MVSCGTLGSSDSTPVPSVSALAPSPTVLSHQVPFHSMQPVTTPRALGAFICSFSPHGDPGKPKHGPISHLPKVAQLTTEAGFEPQQYSSRDQC